MIFWIFIGVMALTFLLTVLVLKRLIPWLKSMKMGQKILDIGPRWHKSKEGTPTMGGLAFIGAMSVTVTAAVAVGIVSGALETYAELIVTFIMALLSGVIGMIDDSAKLRKKQNEGLTASQKFLLQLILAGGYIFAMSMVGGITTELYIPFIGVSLELGILYYVFALVLICGMYNSVNLNDGIDGLCSTMSAAVGGFFALAAFTCGMPEVSLPAGACIGGCLGFLVYNFYPARVFMGDTGSLFLGGLLVGMAFMLDNPLIIVVCGFVYIAETLSVMIQVTYFKLTHGKRFFKMAPIHHHFEKCGWSEIKVVSVFSL
ncbi:MAG: phospho-N-acetylmuramoyl-pentapeptide-transferase, partial [Clostridia bacterium]|nr:phospho-N-acetylmuramoyl-pentapeptide-transferase [Clostridia bacterium]